MAIFDRTPGFRVEEVDLPAPRLPPGRAPLLFAQLSDLHLRVLRRRHDRLVELLNRRRPHFLCLTGDILGRSARTLDLCGELLSRIECPGGVFACTGNWEVKRGLRAAVLCDLMASWGVRLLVNETTAVETPAGPVRVGAVDDLSTGWPSLAEAIRPAEPGGAVYSVLLSHAPLAARLVGPEAGVDLVLSGHTHGGQIRVPLLWRLVLPDCTGGYTAGLYELGWGRLYVNRGFGAAAMLPVRLGCPAEVTFFRVGPA